MLLAVTIIIWIIALAIPLPRRRKRQPQRASPARIRQQPEKLHALPDPDEIEFLLMQREQLLSIAAEIEQLPDGEKKTRKQIAIDKQLFTVDKKLKRLYY